MKLKTPSDNSRLLATWHLTAVGWDFTQQVFCPDVTLKIAVLTGLNYMQMLSLTFLKDLLVSVHTGGCAQGSQTAAIPAGGGGNMQASLARAQGIQS